MFGDKDRGSFLRVGRLLALPLLTFATAPALAAEYKLFINKDQSTSNVIVFEDNLSATVKHTNEGMELTLPGVEVALDCKSSGGNNSTDSCVIAIGAGAGSTSGGSTSGGSTSGGSTSGGSTSSGDCVTTSWNDCSGSTSGGSTSGGTVSGGSGACANTGGVLCGKLDYGSGGGNATGNTSRITLEPGQTLALPFTVAAGPYYGKVGIVPTSSPFPTDGSQVRMWWSAEAGGKPLADSQCYKNLGAEGAMYWDQAKQLGFGCPIANQQATLFVNLRLCISERTDGSCSSAGATDGTQSAAIYISGATNR